MLYRVPAELDFLLPSYPVDHSTHSQPWRGDLTWTGLDNSAPDAKLAFVHAIETEGDIRSDLWPETLSLRSSRSGFALEDIHNWVKNIAPPLCMFMPGQNRDPTITKNNQTSFRNFAKLLRINKVVAISRWHGPGRVPGSGLIVFPVEASSGLLAAAVFHSTPIPEFSMPSYQVPSTSKSPLPPLNTRYMQGDRSRYSDFMSPSPSPSPILDTPPTSATSPPWENFVKSQTPYASYTVPRTQYLHNSFLSSDIRDATTGALLSPESSNYVLQGGLSGSQPPYSYSYDPEPGYTTSNEWPAPNDLDRQSVRIPQDYDAFRYLAR